MLFHYFKELLKDKDLMKKCMILAVPMMLQSLVVSSVNLVDNLLVGKLGDMAISGVASANRFYNIMVFSTNAIITSCIIFMSQFNGANNEKKMKESFRISLIVGYIIIFAFFFLVMLFPRQLIKFIIDDPEIIEVGARYFKYACYSYIPLGISLTIGASMRALGNAKTPMFISIIAILVNAFFDYGLILGKFGMPRLEVEGAAIATIIARVFEAIVYLSVLKKQDFAFKTEIKDLFKFDNKLLKDIIIKALPLLINETLWSTGMMVLVKAYSYRGPVINAAYSISSTVSDVFFALFAGMATASTVLIGTPLGANRLDEAKENGYKLIIFSLFLAVIFGGGLFLSSFIVPFIYRNASKESLDAASIFLRCMGLCYWLYMFNTQCYFTLRAGGDTKNTMFMDSGFMWSVNIPIVIVLSYFTNINIFVVYVIGQMTDLLKAFISFNLVKKEKWVKNLTVQD